MGCCGRIKPGEILNSSFQGTPVGPNPHSVIQGVEVEETKPGNKDADK